MAPHSSTLARLLCPLNSPGKNTAVGLFLSLPGDLPDTEIKPESLVSPALAGRVLTAELPGKPLYIHVMLSVYNVTEDTKIHLMFIYHSQILWDSST